MRSLLTVASLTLLSAPASAQEPVDATALRGKVMCGYQGWFRSPGDASGMGWMHWSGDPNRVVPETLTFESKLGDTLPISA